jgi:hypothetical protein
MRDEPITVRLSPTEAKKLRRLAKEHGVSRSEAMRRLILVAHDALPGTIREDAPEGTTREA